MRWLTVLIVLMLAGCASAQLTPTPRSQAIDAAGLQLNRDRAECDRLYTDPRKLATPWVKCRFAATGKYRAVTDPLLRRNTSDILMKNEAQALLAAERLDKGKISLAEFRLELAKSNSEAATQRQLRGNSAAMVRAAQDAALPRTRTTYCDTFGDSVNCTTY